MADHPVDDITWKQLAELLLLVMKLIIFPLIDFVKKRQPIGSTLGDTGCHHLQINILSPQVTKRQRFVVWDILGVRLGAYCIKVVRQPDGQTLVCYGVAVARRGHSTT